MWLCILMASIFSLRERAVISPSFYYILAARCNPDHLLLYFSYFILRRIAITFGGPLFCYTHSLWQASAYWQLSWLNMGTIQREMIGYRRIPGALVISGWADQSLFSMRRLLFWKVGMGSYSSNSLLFQPPDLQESSEC